MSGAACRAKVSFKGRGEVRSQDQTDSVEGCGGGVWWRRGVDVGCGGGVWCIVAYNEEE